ncbi:class F sortase [Streptomyces sp. AV19]|uniref:class F sortase n=1 Tax=Streptomyces sp. AV19 TaxID=2793068 RepID=UPI0018FE1712|nr:class F sortase [Streptomyces sp. AV19]MBH1933338.1 class F sortase [Streptomyces sp. AV19]MDG4531949.1 class F sortase [Streptomyces sp. AV19]
MSRARQIALGLAGLACLALPLALLGGGCFGRVGGVDDKAIGTPASADEPQRVRIPSLGVDSPLIRVNTLGKDRSVQGPPPEQGMTAGWYSGGAIPGERGVAVIIGHRDDRDGRTAVFRKLDAVDEGTVIDVERGDGRVLHFVVTRTETVEKSVPVARKEQPASQERKLLLVTCAGAPDPGERPARNLVVHATLRP